MSNKAENANGHNKILQGAEKKFLEVEEVISAFSSGLKEEGALQSKVKYLICLATAIVKGCEWCIISNVQNSLDAGATGEEVIEAASIAVLMDGGAGESRMREVVLKAVEQYVDGYRLTLVGNHMQMVNV
jgi:AhpD family alkylhydroperoxidase